MRSKSVWAIKKGGPIGVALAERFYMRRLSAHTSLSEGSNIGGLRIHAHRGSADRAARERDGCELGVDVEGAVHGKKPRKVELPSGTLTDTFDQFKG
jgi:hypothetical protein